MQLGNTALKTEARWTEILDMKFFDEWIHILFNSSCQGLLEQSDCAEINNISCATVSGILTVLH